MKRFVYGTSCLVCFGAVVQWAAFSKVYAQPSDPHPKLEIQGIAGPKIYTNVRILSIADQVAKIAHDDGVSVIPLSSVPKEWIVQEAPTMRPAASQTRPQETPPARGNPDSTARQRNGSSFDPNHIVFIKTDKGVGSGFIARSNGATYVYTNAHVLCGGLLAGFSSMISSVKTASGRDIPTPFALELSETFDPNAPHGLEDVARFAIGWKEEDGEPYQIVSEGTTPHTEQEVVAYGNSLGGDVITELKGKVVGLGADRIEIDCQIVQGNSGGPVVLEKSKTVIGISTYLNRAGKRNIWAKGTVFDTVRRFAVRPEKVVKWRKMQYTALMASLAELNHFERDTLSLAAACHLNPKANRGGFDIPTQQKGDYVIRQVIADGSRYPLGSTISTGIAKVNQRLGATRANISMAGAVPVFIEFFDTVSRASAQQTASLKNSDRAPYLKQFFPAMISQRLEVHEDFVKQGASRFR